MLKTLLGVFDAVVDGKVSKFVKNKKTVHIAKNGIEAVLSLDENGNRKTWLLTGWNKKTSSGEKEQVMTELLRLSVTEQQHTSFLVPNK